MNSQTIKPEVPKFNVTLESDVIDMKIMKKNGDI